MYAKSTLRLAMVGGALVFMVGLAAGLVYVLLALFKSGQEYAAVRMSLVTPMCVGLIGGAALLYHARNVAAGRASRSLSLRRPSGRVAVVYIAACAWMVSLRDSAAISLVFPLIFTLGAAAPVVAVVASITQRLITPLTWRRASQAFLAGALISTPAAVMLEIMGMMAIGVVIGLAFLPATIIDEAAVDTLNTLMRHPLVVVAVLMVVVAVIAPLVEEAVKAVGLGIVGRQRIASEREAFVVGALCGAGFAIVENMLWGSAAAEQGLRVWLGVVMSRGLMAVLHPLCTGLVAVGWYRSLTAGPRPLVKAYLTSVGLHALWNFSVLSVSALAIIGAYAPDGLRGYLTLAALLDLVFVIWLGTRLWSLMRRTVKGLAQEQDAQAATPSQGPASGPSAPAGAFQAPLVTSS